MEQYQICEERADWIGQQIGRMVSRELQRGHQYINIHVKNDDRGMDYVMVELSSQTDNIMIDAQEEWRRREYDPGTVEG